MRRFLREFRLIPVVLLATICLLGLKMLGLVLDGGFALKDVDGGAARNAVARADPVPRGGRLSNEPGNVVALAERPRTSWAHSMFNFPDVTGSVDSDKQNADKQNAEQSSSRNSDAKPVESGAAPAARPADSKPADAKPTDTKPADIKPAEAKPVESKGPPGGAMLQLNNPNGLPSPGERAVLERLGERRQELDARARELEIRETLVKSAEKRLDTRVNEIKGLEADLNGGAKKKAENDAAQLKGLVTMYENMKPKDAAKIFNRLEMPVLIAVVSQINPRIMADIMAQMQPEVAQRLTVELASKAIGLAPTAPATELPKIEGQPR